MDKSTQFAAAVDRALARGIRSKCDFAEAKLNVLIQKENLGAIKFLLAHNHPRYAKSLEPEGRESEDWKKASEMIKQMIEVVGKDLEVPRDQ